MLYLLPVVLMLPRLAVVFMIYSYPYVSKAGMSTLAKEELKGWQVFVALVYSISVVAYFEAWTVLLATILLTLLIKHFLSNATVDLLGIFMVLA
ncbi:MAG: hypothetical protein Q9M40_12525 [Sulfurimonas sp.]|nr:hypothetical protein [Sulfurimonas sp.]